MTPTTNHLARFRADPSKVRVAVRKAGGRWLAWVEEREPCPDAFPFRVRRVLTTATTARKAVVKALREAERQGMDGIDMGMQWAYEHPQRTVRARAGGAVEG